MDNFDFMAAVKENNPTAHSNLEVALQEAGKNNLQKMIEQEDRQNSFLVESPQIEEMAMIEPMSTEEEMQQPTMNEEEII